jgi:predicted acylesterase/phospholipase RssA
LNAAFIVQGHLKRLEEVWSNLREKDIYRLPDAAKLAKMILGHNLGLLDTAPMEELVRREVDLKKIKASSTKLAFFTTDLCSLETRMITTDEIMSTHELVDVLMATSAVPIAFPPRHLNGRGLWVDGGLVKNTPMQSAIELGVEEIYVVLLHPSKVEACPTSIFQVVARCLDIVLDASASKEINQLQQYNQFVDTFMPENQTRQKVNIHVFQPMTPVDTSLLEIDPERSKRLIKQGYLDAVAKLAEIEKENSSLQVVG